jgi:hypothetical protein
MFKRATVLAALALFALAARPALAPEVMVDINPFGGIYFPIADLVDQDIEGVAVTAKQKLGPLFGARVTVWINESFGVEGGFAYSITDAEGEEAGVTGEEDANVMLGTLMGLYQFAPSPGTPFMLHFGAGPALIIHGGDAYEDWEGTTDIGGSIIFGGTYDVSDMVAIRFNAQDFMYQAKFDQAGLETDGKFQNDLVFTGGVVIKVGR